MIQEAEKHTESDKKRKEVIEGTNHAENILADTEKALMEFKDQLDSGEADSIKTLISDLRSYLSQDSESVEVDQVKKLSGELQQASLKLFELVYKRKAAASDSSSSSSSSTSNDSNKSNDDSVDAEFKDKK